jgi:hypothetical protein
MPYENPARDIRVARVRPKQLGVVFDEASTEEPLLKNTHEIRAPLY